jgi:hypothetical protein
MTDQEGRDRKTGRFMKGFSGRKLAKPKAERSSQPSDPHTVILEEAQRPVAVRDQKGRLKHEPAIRVATRQLTLSAAKGDLRAARQLAAQHAKALEVEREKRERDFKLFGNYLKSLDAGEPWRLSPEEAVHLQNIADAAGYGIEVKPYNPKAAIPPVTSEAIDAILADRDVAYQFDCLKITSEQDRRSLVRRIVRLERQRAFELGR